MHLLLLDIAWRRPGTHSQHVSSGRSQSAAFSRRVGSHAPIEQTISHASIEQTTDGTNGGLPQVGPEQAFNERFQAMRPTMPWAPPPWAQLPEADTSLAAGEDSLEAHVSPPLLSH